MSWCNNISYEELAEHIKKNDKDNDWTKNKSKEEIEIFCKEYIENSKLNKLECEKYNIKFVDTSIDRQEKLNSLIKEIESFI